MSRVSVRTPLAALAALSLLPLAASAQGGPPPPPPAPFPTVQAPVGNPITPDKVLLGKALFWDEQMSSSRTMACATCHIPGNGGTDPRAVQGITTNPGFDGLFGTSDDVTGSLGAIQSNVDGLYEPEASFGLDVQVTTRKANSVINAAFPQELFWDGRATSTFFDPLTGAQVLAAGAALESQAAEPPISSIEMGHLGEDWAEVATRIAGATPLAMASGLPTDLANFVAGRSYPQLFQDAFGSAEVSPARIAMAIATYQRTLISDQNPNDDFVQGNPTALTPLELQGLNVFNGVGRCGTCHGGPLLTDNLFHNTGVRPNFEDQGRFDVTGIPADRGRFKTPGLRNVELMAPYFHNGSAATLEEVVEFYDRGGDFHVNQSPLIIPLNLPQNQKDALVAYLKRPLNDPRVLAETAPFDGLTLYSETQQTPDLYGSGTPTPQGVQARMVAVEPPLIGSSELTLGLADGPGFGQAMLAVDFATGSFDLLGAEVLVGATSNMLLLQAGPMKGVAGEGYASLNLSIPTDPTLQGLSVYTQWFVLNTQGLFTTEGAELTLF
ncbi:MAG: cytochrome c peroxidase [Planctomycetota bacterium]|nr:cytochrome c peroxidase [Planctomycetota bacterium]